MPKFQRTHRFHVCNNINHISGRERIKDALTIHHKAVRDGKGETQDFDVTLKVASVGNMSWTKISGPPSGVLMDPTSSTATFRNPTKGGLYTFQLAIGGVKAAILQLWLPVAGPEISSYWETEIAYFKNTWGPAYRKRLDDMFMNNNNEPSLTWILRHEITAVDMAMVGEEPDWNGDIIETQTPCGGPSNTPGNRLTVHGSVISWSKRNNVMYALIGSEMGFFEWALIAGGAVVNLASSGTSDSAESKEACHAGFDLFNGAPLRDVMNARGLKMHEINGWDDWEWPSEEVPNKALIRTAESKLQNLLK